MKFGHHGANQSVKNLSSKKIMITSQSHNYEVCEKSLENTNLVVTLQNLSDNSIEGLASTLDKVITCQFDSSEASCSPVVKSVKSTAIT